MNVNVNYKLLDYSIDSVSLVEQLVTIFNKMYGGDPDSVISDTVALISEAGILDIVATHNAEDFYQNRGGVEYEVFQRLQKDFKDYHLNCTSVFILNMDFDSTYQKAIVKIMAESQRIQEKTNLLNGTTIQSETSVKTAQLQQAMEYSTANTTGLVYQKVQASKATAVATYNGKLTTALTTVDGFIPATKTPQKINRFFYLLVTLD